MPHACRCQRAVVAAPEGTVAMHTPVCYRYAPATCRAQLTANWVVLQCDSWSRLPIHPRFCVVFIVTHGPSGSTDLEGRVHQVTGVLLSKMSILVPLFHSQGSILRHLLKEVRRIGTLGACNRLGTEVRLSTGA